MAEKAKGTRGRPTKQIDWGRAERLWTLFCTDEDVAYVLGVSVDTLTRREEYKAIKARGQAKARASLRHIQFKHAENNPTMAIYLGKVLLGQVETQAAPEKEATGQMEKLAKLLTDAEKKYSKPFQKAANGPTSEGRAENDRLLQN